jgi:hypothetical protein
VDYGRNPGLGRLARRRGARALGPGDLPDLVTFADPADPRSVMAVDAADLAASLGAGVRLRRATIEVTGDPVTEGVIEQRLPWLRGMTGSLAGGDGIASARTDLAGSIGRLSLKMRGH